MKKTIFALFMLFAGTSNAAIISAGNVTSNGSGSYTISNGSGSVSDTSVENFIGLSNGTLDAISTGNATEGSAIKDSFFISAGDVFSFDWLWSSNEGNNAYYNDFSFVHISLDGTTLLADTFTPDNTTGTFSWTATSSGVLNYGIGVMDTNDAIVNSFLTVSDITLASNNVPEPAILYLILFGLVGFSFIRNKQPLSIKKHYIPAIRTTLLLP